MFRHVMANVPAKQTRKLSLTSSSSSSDDDEGRVKSLNRSAYEGRRRENSGKTETTATSAVDSARISRSPSQGPSSDQPERTTPKVAFEEPPRPMPTPDSIVPAMQKPVSPLSEKEKAMKSLRSDQQHGPGVLRTVLSAFLIFAAAVGYCLIGGLMFSYLEQSNEKAECLQLRYLYEKTRNATSYNLYDIALSPNLGDEDKLEAFLPILDTFRSSIHNISWDGRTCETMTMKWSVVGATFFSFTIVSTIGFGHIAPKTNWGRLVCIAYAVVGLPLMLMSLAKIGAVFAHYFRAFYFKLLCCGLCIRKRRNQLKRRASMAKRSLFRWKLDNDKKNSIDLVEDISSDEEENIVDSLGANIPLLLSLTVAASSVLIGILIYMPLQNWTASEAAYFSFISLATIGFGDLVPGYSSLTGATNDLHLVITAFYLFCGMALLSMALQMMQDEVIEKFRWLVAKTRQICCRKKASYDKSRKGSKTGGKYTGGSSNSSSQASKVNVPPRRPSPLRRVAPAYSTDQSGLPNQAPTNGWDFSNAKPLESAMVSDM